MHRAFLVLAAVAATSRLAAGEPAESRRSHGGASARDTILWKNLAAPRPGEGVKDPRLPRLRLGLRSFALPFELSPAEGHPPAFPRSPFLAPEVWASRALAVLELHRRPEARLDQVLAARVLLPSFPPPGAGPASGPLTPAPFQEQEAQGVRSFMGDVADLGVRVRGRAELGGDWSRFRPCLDVFQDACNTSLFPQLSPELRFAVQVGGTISERIHLDVDFDQLREFEGANRINVVYEGTPGERIQRLELGDVTFRLPTSRFLTQGIPAGNFGFRATGQLGALEIQGVWAEQRGDLTSRVFRLSGMGPGRGFVQSDTLVLDDADYSDGQFFFLVDPAEIVGYPHIDVLSLDGAEASTAVAPGPEPVQLYRYENEPALRQQVEGFIQADAVAERNGERVIESGWFRYLQPGVDYFVHTSGLWIALRNPLGTEEMLAVTYVTAVGDTVGDYNPERLYNSQRRPELRLLKASAANHQPGRPTWEMEMHQVYRVSASPDVERASVSVTISLGELSAGRTFKRGSTGEDFTFLRIFGLDQEAPLDAVDPAFIFEPARDLFQDQPPVQGAFVVFPTLRPFAVPPPLPSLDLSEADTRELLGAEANPGIYDDPDPFERENGGRFRLTIPFRVQSADVISSFSLGALGIREGSERIFVGERLLLPGVDYQIDYDVGQVTLVSPETLFSADPEASVRATWEQKPIFQMAPTSVFGLSTHAGLGTLGGLDFLGLYQTEKTLTVRPTLGLEPGATLLGGVSGRVGDDLPWLDGLMERIPQLRAGQGSGFSIDGEGVVSLPTPNTRGDVFVDDFDAPAERPLSLLSNDWTLGSAPAYAEGAQGVLPGVLDESTFTEMGWQHAWIIQGASADSVGIQEGFFPRQEIDHQIRFAGSEIKEPGLLLSFGARTRTGGVRRWSSITTTLSPTGADLTKTEFLEFYAAQGQNLALVIDLGAVSEDAFFVDPLGRTSGTKAETAVPWGLGLLDQEADPSRGEVWGDRADQRGVWGEICVAERGKIYRVGDIRANCTRGNGRRDTEDLDGDGNLDDREKVLRWVVRLDGSSPFLVRRRSETGTAFQLYRIPLQAPGAEHVGGAFSDADMRAVKNIRITVTGARAESLTLARMRIVGSRWIRRNQDGVLRGLAGDTLSGIGRVEATPVSRVTEGEAYVAPPGVLEQLSDPSAAFGGQGIEFSEKSLAVRFEDVQPGDRAEVYHRFPQRPRSFLTYRQARLWVVARSGDWGPDAPARFFFKVGTDPENFYLFQTPLRPPSSASGVISADWLPEVEVDFDEWLRLRYLAEQELILNPREPSDPPLFKWSPDSTYAVVLNHRGQGPDLANVREMAFGVWNQGSRPIRGEFWVDELRLSEGVTDAGLAGHLDVLVQAANVLDTRLTLSTRGAFFRQLRESPTYQTDEMLSLTSTLRLDRFTPAEWGVDLPLTLTHDRFAQDPVFLVNSDVRANRLRGLRASGDRQTRISLGFRKLTPASSPVASVLLDGLNANVEWFTSEAGTVTSKNETSGVDARLGYARRPGRRDVGLVPGFLQPVVRVLLPDFLEEPLLEARFRWTPEVFSLGASYLRRDSRIFRFDRIITLAGDSLVVPARAPRESMETSGLLTLRPFDPLTADLTLFTTRDLVRPDEAVADSAAQDLIRAERHRLAGVDWGWETNRTVRTRVAFRPQVLPWLRHEVDWSTSFSADRNASFVGRVVSVGDTTFALQRNASGERNLRAFLSLDPPSLGRGILGGAPAGARSGWLIPELLAVLSPLSVTWQGGLTSRFIRESVDPGLDYQLGLGELDAFRFLDGDTASTLTDRKGWRVGGGLALPAGIGVGVGWATTQAATLDVRSDRTVRDETWPDVRVRVDALPVPGPARGVLERVSVTAGYLESLREVEFGGQGQQRRTQLEREVPVDVTLSWTTATTTTYRGAFRVGKGRDPTGATELDRVSHRVSLTSALAAPESLAALMDRPLLLTLILSYGAERECRTTASRPTCVAYIDQLDRSVGVTLSASVQRFEVGLQSSFLDRQSYVGQHTGSTQFQLGFFGQFLFEAGEFPLPPLGSAPP